MLAVVPGVTAASSVRIVQERHPRGGGTEGSANLPARSLAACMAADRHSPTSVTLRLQGMIRVWLRVLLIFMVDRIGELLPDPAHAVAVAGGAEGLEVPERMGSAADRRLPEVEMR